MIHKIPCTILLFLFFISPVNATTVVFDTSQGPIKVNLFDQTTPKTVDNFLQYIDEQHYTNSVVHRVASNFVVQGGGFTFEGNWPLTRIETNAAIVNEPIYSNVKGTIAMAKVGGNQSSATDKWFFYLANNASKLDLQEGGFTVFGQVIDADDMAVIDKIAGLTRCQDIPMIDYSTQNCSDQSTPGIENFVVINQVTIIDPSEVTDANLTPIRNTLLTEEEESEPESTSSGGGTFAWFTMFCLIIISIRNLTIQSK